MDWWGTEKKSKKKKNKKKKRRSKRIARVKEEDAERYWKEYKEKEKKRRSSKHRSSRPRSSKHRSSRHRHKHRSSRRRSRRSSYDEDLSDSDDRLSDRYDRHSRHSKRHRRSKYDYLRDRYDYEPEDYKSVTNLLDYDPYAYAPVYDTPTITRDVVKEELDQRVAKEVYETVKRVQDARIKTRNAIASPAAVKDAEKVLNGAPEQDRKEALSMVNEIGELEKAHNTARLDALREKIEANVRESEMCVDPAINAKLMSLWNELSAVLSSAELRDEQKVQQLQQIEQQTTSLVFPCKSPEMLVNYLYQKISEIEAFKEGECGEYKNAHLKFWSFTALNYYEEQLRHAVETPAIRSDMKRVQELASQTDYHIKKVTDICHEYNKATRISKWAVKNPRITKTFAAATTVAATVAAVAFDVPNTIVQGTKAGLNWATKPVYDYAAGKINMLGQYVTAPLNYFGLENWGATSVAAQAATQAAANVAAEAPLYGPLTAEEYATAATRAATQAAANATAKGTLGTALQFVTSKPTLLLYAAKKGYNYAFAPVTVGDVEISKELNAFLTSTDELDPSFQLKAVTEREQLQTLLERRRYVVTQKLNTPITPDDKVNLTLGLREINAQLTKLA